MGWKETNVVNERQEFIEAYMKHTKTFKALCDQFGISEKTGHKWKNRFIEGGLGALEDQSRAPLRSPQTLDEDVILRLIRLRIAHPYWGAKKLAVLYQRAYPSREPPAVSSIQRVLGKVGMLETRSVRKAAPDASRLRRAIHAEKPNDVWTVDFKGWWISSGEHCVPLTVRDADSRFVLDIRLMRTMDTKAVQAVFRDLFKKYGMPKAIHSDNGSPFASNNAPLGLTKLSCWWISLGIFPERSAPGTPLDNAAHERLHADIAREIEKKTPGGIAANQIVIDQWVSEYNHIRPHEALGMLTPADCYTPSETGYTKDFDSIDYPLGFQSRKVLQGGQIALFGQRVRISTALSGLTVGLQPLHDGSFNVWLAEFFLGVIDPAACCFSVVVEVQSSGT